MRSSADLERCAATRLEQTRLLREHWASVFDGRSEDVAATDGAVIVGRSEDMVATERVPVSRVPSGDDGVSAY